MVHHAFNCTVISARGYAKAGRLMAYIGERVLFDGFAEFLGQCGDAMDICLRAYDQKFLAAPASDMIRFACVCLQKFCKLFKHHVTLIMSKYIIHLFKIIDVDEYDG